MERNGYARSDSSITIYREVNTDLLWWFEGATSWIGDILCLRAEAWSPDDYFADMKRKLKRHHTRSGSSCQALCEASHEAWIHLYRSYAHSRKRKSHITLKVN